MTKFKVFHELRVLVELDSIEADSKEEAEKILEERVLVLDLADVSGNKHIVHDQKGKGIWVEEVEK